MDDILGLVLGPVVSCSAPASRPSASSANSSIQKYSTDRIQLPIVLDFHSDRGRKDIEKWYRKQPATWFTHIEYRRDTHGRFKHEFVVVCLRNSTICRFDRRAREDVRGHALKDEGTASEDSAHVITLADTESKARLDESEVLMRIDLELGQDLDFILAVCYGIQSHPKAKSYSLLQYNCYFFSWTLVTIINRRDSKWQLIPGSQETWQIFSSRIITLIKDERRSWVFWSPREYPRFAWGSGLKRFVLGAEPPPHFHTFRIRCGIYDGMEKALRAHIPSMLSEDALERVLFQSHLTPMMTSEVLSVFREGSQLGAEEVVKDIEEWEKNHRTRRLKLTPGAPLRPRLPGDDGRFKPSGTAGNTSNTGATFRPVNKRLRHNAEKASKAIYDARSVAVTEFVGTHMLNDFLLNNDTYVQEYVKKRIREHLKQVESYGFGKAGKLIEQAEESMTEIWVSVVDMMKGKSRLSFL